MLERRRYGPIGFNIPYEFSDGDFIICAQQLSNFLMSYNNISKIPIKALKFTAAEINYGGRITDEMDRKVVNELLAKFYNEQVAESDSYSYDDQGVYINQRRFCEWKKMLDFMKRLPMDDPVSLLGLDENAKIIRHGNESESISASFITLSHKPMIVKRASVIGGESIANQMKQILASVPKEFEIRKIAQKYPPNYLQSMNTFLVQDCLRYNKLLTMLRTTCDQLIRCMSGEIIMTSEMEDLLSDIQQNCIPKMWKEVSYPSTKSLNSWLLELKERVEFYTNWINQGIPEVFWFPGIFFPQSFLTCILQNFARLNKLPIDSVGFKFEVLENEQSSRLVEKPGSVLISGLYLQCASWNPIRGCLENSKPREEYVHMQPIRLIPTDISKQIEDENERVYKCPVYRTLTRSGLLSTTGHSTNFVFSIDLPTGDFSPSHWMLRGTALFCTVN
ncbi:hypothetical protein ACOME3_006209 [Neoechinorhynchus agilis]